MFRRFLPGLAWAFLAAVILLGARPSEAASGAYLKGDASSCRGSTAAVERQYSDFPLVPELTFSVSGGTWGGDLCFVSLFEEDAQSPLFVVADANGRVVQQLDGPAFTDPHPANYCYTDDVAFDDVNGDDCPDFIIINECEQDNDQGYINDNVVYLSREINGVVVWTQDRGTNAQISKYPYYAQIRNALVGAGAPPAGQPAPSVGQPAPSVGQPEPSRRPGHRPRPRWAPSAL